MTVVLYKFTFTITIFLS